MAGVFNSIALQGVFMFKEKRRPDCRATLREITEARTLIDKT